MDIILIIGLVMFCVSTHFLWKGIKYNKRRAAALRRLEEIFKD